MSYWADFMGDNDPSALWLEWDYVMVSTDGINFNVVLELTSAYPDGMTFDQELMLALPSSPTTHVAFVRDTPDGGSAAWGVDFLNIFSITSGEECIFFEDFEDCPIGDTWDAQRTVAGDYWDIDSTYLPDFAGSDSDGDGLVHVVHGYGNTGPGLNDALYTTIELPDTYMSASAIFDQVFTVEEGSVMYIEVSDDFEPGDNMATSGATWLPVYSYANPFTGPVTNGGWEAMSFSLNDYIPALGTGSNEVTIRFRFTTAGEGTFAVYSPHGWAIDAFGIQYQEITLTDDTAPISSLVFDGLTATVSIFAFDPVMPLEAAPSGVKATYYKLDGGSTQTYSGPFTIAEGTHVVTYWSEDNAGNVETQHTSPTLIVDTTAPTVSITSPEDALYLFGSKLIAIANPICIGKITIVAAASDTGGINIVTFAIDGDSGFDATAPYEYVYRGPKFGTASVTVTAYDFVGLSATATKEFRIFSLGLL
jgi:hypothetical protein